MLNLQFLHSSRIYFTKNDDLKSYIDEYPKNSQTQSSPK